jgi:hypothetical protein
MMAARYGYLDIVKYLRSKGAAIEREKGYECVHATCFGGDLDTLKFLIEDEKINANPET